MKPEKSGIAPATVTALAAAFLFAATSHATASCMDGYDDSPASSYCTVTEFSETTTANEKVFCLPTAPVCSLSFTYGAPGADDSRASYDVTLPINRIGIVKSAISTADFCIQETTTTGGATSFEAGLSTGGCKTDEHTAAQAVAGAFHEDD